jgi:hypothetical protein
MIKAIQFNASPTVATILLNIIGLYNSAERDLHAEFGSEEDFVEPIRVLHTVEDYSAQGEVCVQLAYNADVLGGDLDSKVYFGDPPEIGSDSAR